MDADIWAAEYDPSITIEELDSIHAGQLFPRKKGMATAAYAHMAYRALPLDKAVDRYLRARERDKRTKKPAPRAQPYARRRIYSLIKEHNGIILDDWDRDRDGWAVCIVEQRTKKNPIADLSFNDGGLPVIAVDVPFGARTKPEARRIVDAIAETIRKANAPRLKTAKLDKFLFSGNIAFVASLTDPKL